MANTTTYRVRIADGFDDPACSPDRWRLLLGQSATCVPSLTRDWLAAWWSTLGTGRLLLVVAERDDEPIALAPLYADQGMVFFLGAGEADTFDFLGGVEGSEFLATLLDAARSAVPGFLGFKLHLLPQHSRVATLLNPAAEILGLDCYLESELPAFAVDLVQHREAILTSTNRSMLKRENWFRERGPFEVQRFQAAAEILPQIDGLIRMHIHRWQGKEYDNPLEGPDQQEFLKRLAAAGHARFLRIDWNRQPLALGLAWYFQGTHYAGPWSFDPAYARHCPGHVLLRQMLLMALDENLTCYDVRGGEEHYKDRLPTHSSTLQTWGLYPRE